MPTRGLPKYLCLKRELLRSIRSARPGDRVDSEHELVAKYTVSRATVAKAIGELVAEGFLYREQGRGTFVADTQGRADGALGFIYYSWQGGLSDSDYFSAVLAGVEAGAREAGRDILFMAGKTLPGEEFHPPSPADLARKGVAGLICVGVDSDDHLAALLASGLPMVSVDYQTERLDLDAVVGGTEMGGYQGTRQLFEEGHTRIAFLGMARHGSRAYQAPDQGSLERLAGYRRAHAERGVEVDEELVLQPRQRELSFPARLEQLAAAGKAPTAVFSATVGGILDAVLAWGRERGAPLEAVGADCLPLSDLHGEPRLRACEDPREMGRSAVKMLMGRIAGESGPARRVVVPCQMMVVESGEARPLNGPAS